LKWLFEVLMRCHRTALLNVLQKPSAAVGFSLAALALKPGLLYASRKSLLTK
jgi:hypothetical protein